MQITIRSAVPADALLLSQLGIQTFRETYAEFNDPADLESHIAGMLSEAHFQKAIASLSHQLFLLFAGDEAAGFTQLTASPGKESPGSIEVHRFYIRQQYQGRGLGAKLMQHAIDFAREKGYRSLWLGVWKENPKAIAFYRKMGFQVTGEHIFLLGSDPQEDWIMSLDLKEC